MSLRRLNIVICLLSLLHTTCFPATGLCRFAFLPSEYWRPLAVVNLLKASPVVYVANSPFVSLCLPVPSNFS